MINDLDGLGEYKGEAISQGARDYFQPIQILQVPVTIKEYNHYQTTPEECSQIQVS